MKLRLKHIKKYTSLIKPYIFDSVGSTNAVARDLAQDGAEEGTAVIAERQTAGRGRLGRSFFSPDGGIYLSLVLRPEISPEDTLFITVAAAVAAAQAIQTVSRRKCEIKWVNDIYINGKKVCGILTEGVLSQSGNGLDYAILGIGINIFEPKGGYPEDIPTAGSVFSKKSNIFQKNALKAQIIGAFANKFFEFYDNLQAKEYIKEYQARSLLTGKSITYTKAGKNYRATVIGIDDNARLIVKSDEETSALSTGEVQITQADDLFDKKK